MTTSDKPSRRPRERRSSWSQLQTVRKPNRPRRDSSPCGGKCAAVPHPRENKKRATAHSGGGGIEQSIIRFFGKGVASRSSKKSVSEKKDREKDRSGRHGDCPRPADSHSQVTRSSISKTASKKEELKGVDSQRKSSEIEAEDTETASTGASKTEDAETGPPKTNNAGTQTETTAAPTSKPPKPPKAPAPGTDVSDPPAASPTVAEPTAAGLGCEKAAPTSSEADDRYATAPTKPGKKKPKVPARPGPKKNGLKQQDETGPAPPRDGASPACACACACAKPGEDGKEEAAAEAVTRAGEPGDAQPEAETTAATPAPDEGARPGKDGKDTGTAAEMDYGQEPGPAGRVDASWLGTFRDRLMGS
ncbi:hypothetical protein LX36DRAFT_733592 [Colletotrichum falcatum]|nr:hypothetical protein LX36DRAFT_733592 [Colletotrichum falcatum]